MSSTISAGTTAGSSLAFSGDTSGALVLQTNGTTTAVTIDTSQNVGIGTSSPVTRLDVVGGTSSIRGAALFNTSSTAGTGSSAYIRSANAFSSATTPDYTWWFNDQCGLFHPAGDVIGFSTNGTEQARIDSSGNVTAGGTTSYGKITSAASSGYCFGTDSVGNGADHFRFTSGGGTTTGSITRVGGTNVAYNTSSDYRLKYNISPMTGALDKVAKLKPCTYTWRLDDSDGEGFIAHELAEVCPHAVSGEKDAVDENGDIKAQGIDTSFLVATLTAAIQEAHALIIQLQADVAALKGVK